jgi:hypothetical protein
MTVGVFCSSMPCTASFFRKYRFDVTVLTSLRYLFSRGSRRSKDSISSGTESNRRLEPYHGEARVETRVLGTMKGLVHDYSMAEHADAFLVMVCSSELETTNLAVCRKSFPGSRSNSGATLRHRNQREEITTTSKGQIEIDS